MAQLHGLALLLLLAAAGLVFLYLRNKKKPPYKGQYNYCPGCGSKLKLLCIDGKERRGCKACGFVHWNNPIPVVTVVIPHGNGLVFVKRKFNPGKGKYALPGGFVDPGESPEEAAVREALEETHLHVRVVRMLKAVALPVPNQILLFYLVEPVTEQPVAGDDAEEAIVARPDSLPGELAFESHRVAIGEYFTPAKV